MATKPLPPSLQDICLCVVMNDLDSYPVELLASLPRWMRYRLLDNLPAHDLCRLDRTSMVKGVNIEEIWNSRVKLPRHPSLNPRNDMASFSNFTPSTFYQDSLQAGDMEACEGELVTALSTRHSGGSQSRERYLCNALSAIFGESKNLTEAVDMFISVRENFFQYQPSPTDPTVNRLHNQHRVPVHQLAQTTTLTRYQGYSSQRLAPHRLLPIYKRYVSDPLGLFSLIVHKYGLQPVTISIELHPFPSWKQCLLETKKLTNVLDHFLHKTVALELRLKSVFQCKAVTPILQKVLEAVLRSSERSQLKSLHFLSSVLLTCLSPYFFTLPGNPTNIYYQGLGALELGKVYKDSFPHCTALLEHQSKLEYVCLQLGDVRIIEDSVINLFSALSSLFSRPQFKVLRLDLGCNPRQYVSLLFELLQQFMTAPCSHATQLHLLAHLPLNHKTEPISFLDTTDTVPECGLQHKTITLDSGGYVTGLLLPMPTIRLKNIRISYRHLHLGALHPDLHVAKLTVQLYHRLHRSTCLATLQDDLTTLFQKPTLQEINITGNWEKCEGIALGSALCHRAQVGPLQRITICNSYYGKEEFREIWDAVFSLPQLDQMELVIGSILSKLILRNKHLLYESWKQFGSQHQVKLLQFTMYKQKGRTYEQLNNIATTVSFTDTQPKVSWPSHNNMWKNLRTLYFDLKYLHSVSSNAQWLNDVQLYCMHANGPCSPVNCDIATGLSQLALCMPNSQ